MAASRRYAVIYRRAVIDNHRGALRLYVTHSLNGFGTCCIRVELKIDVSRAIYRYLWLKLIAGRDWYLRKINLTLTCLLIKAESFMDDSINHYHKRKTSFCKSRSSAWLYNIYFLINFLIKFSKNSLMILIIYSIIGAIRVIAQTLSYEVRLILIVLGLILINESYSFINFIKWQIYIWYLCPY